MKWLAGGLTFANFATVFGLLFGMIAGLGPFTSVTAFILAAGVGAVAYVATTDSGPVLDSEASTVRYRNLVLWVLAAIFAIFAFRSFIWLVYVDGADLKIQSPVNLGDLGLHLTHIQFFANGVKLWPSNPIYVGSEHLRYPAGIDLLNALLLKSGISLIPGLVWVGLLASLATFYAFYRWGGAFAIAGFLFNGGIAGFQFLKTFEFNDYQDVNHVAWKCIPQTMFVTQRGLLYAIPAGLILLWHWREKFYPRAGQNPSENGQSYAGAARTSGPLPFWVELSLYAAMPLFHIHTFIALSILLVCFFICGDAPMRGHTLRLVLSAVIPATFFVWLITDHFHARSVIEFHPGWVQRDDGEFKMPFFRFWFFNFGILVPLLLTLVGFLSYRVWQQGFQLGRKQPEEIAFVFGAAIIFLFTFLVKTAPWGWDNLKIMIWSYFIVLPYLWRDLIVQWERPIRWAVCFALFASGFVSLFGGLAAGKGGFGFASRGEVDAVSAATRPMPIEARFAAWPTYNHPLLLSGRKVVMGYPGHLWTQGFDDYGKTNDTLSKLMQGAPNWRDIARTLHVRYIFWGREEKGNYATSSRPWEKTALLAAAGSWGAIYDLEKPAPPDQAPPPSLSQ
ncbi:MAG TPA: hypothetical protein VLK27_09725 [Chthoniobacterales bacterium]|nr:hypothetical protein [Chthoniobacterales bacterium]